AGRAAAAGELGSLDTARARVPERGRIPLPGMRASLHIGLRLLQAVFVVWGFTLVTFIVSRVLPGNPAYLLAGQNADAETIAAMTRRLGLDRSIPDQYGIYMKNLVRG